MLPRRVKIPSTGIRHVGEAVIFVCGGGLTAKFLFTYVKFEVEKGHPVETDNWRYRITVLHRTQENC